ncbi:MAG: ABC transporter ATP-binding protein [Candidatus Latescibacteria bacterium]|jgi:putative ABC transport system ATP-binding protein|nr:ABC transporter ATP-binding protein [Candidatus Latescibacterota bacterium]
MAIVELSGVHKTYLSGKNVQTHALRGLDLTIDKGEFAAIAGPSGSGKTTLLNIIGCLDTADEGRVVVDGQDVTALKDSALADLRRDRIGFIFQAYNLVPVLTALENVEFVMLLQKVPESERQDRAVAVLKEVGLGDYIERRPNEMSGGQQQRIAVARAIAAEPSLVLADEPTANLDSETATALMALMRRLNEEKQVTFLFSTHDKLVMDHAQRLVHLRDGMVAEDERRA